MIERKNFSGNPNPDVGGETHFRRCNFAQPEPVDQGGDVYTGVPILTGSGPCTFENCNLVNCEVPAGSTITKCNTTIRRSKVEIRTDELVIDGLDLSPSVYADIIYGRQTEPGVYEYQPEPVVLERQGVEEVE